MSTQTPMIEMRSVGKRFGSVIALNDISMKVCSGEVMCLLGDNGAGKSTLIKTLSGVHKPTEGEMLVAGKPTRFRNPAKALDAGIATVFQDLAMIPMMSITRNFFMGREPTIGWGPFKRIDWQFAERVAREEMAKIGIDIRDPSQPVGTLSGGERQCVAIARAVYFGAKVLILDEPTSALGVKQASVVLRYIAKARSDGLAVIFITHNVHHAYPVADAFTLLKRGTSLGTFRKSEVSREEVLNMMAGGAELESLDAELAEFQRNDRERTESAAPAVRLANGH
ncbi:ATP-binding cassette domain-containing protein [Halomonas sp. B23F22_10]|uniref:ATP-binding cassette domain-containing protein n=1 Tax=Halomonas sp. B23F22_10 TaxID=3459515 RepID=UPI00373ED4D0